MKSLTILVAVVIAVSAKAQDCSQYNASSPVSWSIAGSEHHISGAHTFIALLTGTCSYSGSTPGSPCATTCVANASLTSKVDTGTRISIQGNPGTQETHYLGQNGQNGSATAPRGGTTIRCGVTGAVVANTVNNTNITFINVSPDGTSAQPVYPPGAIFGRSSGNIVSCPSETLPVQTGGGCSSGGCCSNLSQCYYVGSGMSCDLCSCICYSSSPIIVDTTGHGFHLTSAQNGVLFDFRGNGKPNQLSWTAADSGNGFLALDRDGNGTIDNGAELFGNMTPQPKSGDPNGYIALAEFDKAENGGNGDGIIDFNDQIYSKLVIWVDANHDGVSQPQELHSLPSMGVYSIGLTYTQSERTDQYGNRFRYRGVLNPSRLDGTSRDGRFTYDVFFVGAASPSNVGGCKDKKPVVTPVTQRTTDPLLETLN